MSPADVVSSNAAAATTLLRWNQRGPPKIGAKRSGADSSVTPSFSTRLWTNSERIPAHRSGVSR